MKFESFFIPKPEEEVQKQVEKSSDSLGVNLIHETMEQDLGLLDVKDLKEKYQLRYNAYVAILRAERKGKTDEHLEQKEARKAKVWINALNNLDDYIQKQENGENKVLRGRQIPIFNEIRNAIERGVTRGYIKLPTGVGKTVLFSQLIEALNLKTLIGVPSLPLVTQTSDKMEQFTTKSFGTYSGGKKDSSKDITTITYQSLINAVRDGKIKSEDFPVFVLDEVHKALGPETSKAVQSMEDSLQIGFTATPTYSDKHAVLKLLKEEICNMSLREAIEEGLVNRTKTIHAYTEVDLSLVDINNGDYDKDQLEKVINVHGRNMAALELYKNKFSDQKAIVNCSGVQHAKDVAELFQEQGIKSAHIDGSMDDDTRSDILQKLATGELMVVTNAKLLLEGFDEPTVSVALNLKPTLSMVDAEQRGGRAARLDDNNPDKWAYVIDFIDKNAKKKQVLFSEILGSDAVIPEAVSDKNNIVPRNTEERERIFKTSVDFSDLDISELRVVVNTQEIMEVTREYEESRIEKEQWALKDIQSAVQAKQIKSSSDYQNQSSTNNWPYFATLTNMPEFPKNPDGSNDWNTFLGIEKVTFKDIQSAVQAKQIKSSGDYANQYSINKWPAIITLTNMSEFPKNPDGSNDWNTFLGIEKVTFKDIQSAVQLEQIQSSTVYKNQSSIHKWPDSTTLTSMPEFPKKPNGKNDWNTFLGIEKITFKDIQSAVQVEKITSSTVYQNQSSIHKWPNVRTLTNMPEFPKSPDGSNDWDTFLGKNNKE